MASLKEITSHIADLNLWNSFGIRIESGQVSEIMIFDPEKGTSLIDVIGYYFEKDFCGQLLSEKEAVFTQINPTPEQIGKAIDDLLYNYFFQS